MPGISDMLKGTQIKANLRERMNALMLIPDNAVSMVSTAVDGVTALKPVKAITDTGKLLGNGLFDFIQKQADVTRKWLPKKS
jgi:hypothetical protein